MKNRFGNTTNSLLLNLHVLLFDRFWYYANIECRWWFRVSF